MQGASTNSYVSMFETWSSAQVNGEERPPKIETPRTPRGIPRNTFPILHGLQAHFSSRLLLDKKLTMDSMGKQNCQGTVYFLEVFRTEATCVGYFSTDLELDLSQ